MFDVRTDLIFTFIFGLVMQQCAAGEVYRIGLLGCHKQEEPSPSLTSYVLAKPDLCLWVGDNIYADTENDPEALRQGYAHLNAKPAFRQLRANFFTMAVWDDHDYGLNNFGRDYPLKEQSKGIFREFWNLESEIPDDHPGVYYAKTFKQAGSVLQVITLDGRFNREDPGPESDTLGQAQWSWLERQLREPADLRLIVSGYQVLIDAESKWETWGKFPKARQRLFDLIKRTRAERVVFITGDQHYAEVSRIPEALGYDAIEIMFAGINQIEPPDFNRWRVSPVSESLHTMALVDIQWDRNEFDPPHLVLTVRNTQTDKLELTYRVNFSELEFTD